MANYKKTTRQQLKILVLGGFGFIGTSVVSLLSKKYHYVQAASRKNGLNLLHEYPTKKYFQTFAPDAIINCAAHKGSVHYDLTYPADIAQNNLRMNLNIYKAAQSTCPKAVIINLIPNCTYPGDLLVQKENEWLNGPVHPSVWSYANTKRMLQALSVGYWNQYGIVSKNYIIPNVYGPGDSIDPQKTHALNGLIIRMLLAKRDSENTCEIWGTGKPKREWIFVEDVSRAIELNLENIQPQLDPINIAQNKAYSITQIAIMIRRISQFKGRLIYNTSYPDGAPVKKLNDSIFRSRYPNFHFTDLQKGIQQTVLYYQKLIYPPNTTTT
jgi:GDP-L-fucose synthase